MRVSSSPTAALCKEYQLLTCVCTLHLYKAEQRSVLDEVDMT